VYVLIGRLAERKAAAVLAVCFLIFQTFNPTFVVANHRWDSAAFALCAAVCGFLLVERQSHGWAIAAGACAGLAAWTTFSFAAMAAAVAIWLLIDRRLRRFSLAYAAGGIGVSAAFVGWLAWSHALRPMVEGVLWSARNYAGPNRTVYGYVVGGYDHLFAGAGAIESILLCVLLLVATLPASMPLVCAGWLPRLRAHPEKRLWFLLVCAAGVLISTWPRPDMTHLMYVFALPYVLASVLLWRTLNLRARCALGALLVLVATCEAGIGVYRRITEPTLATRVGVVHGKPEDLAVLRTIQAQISSEQTVFVFPYWPVFYFTTGARNPTRFSYLQPGMFPKQDEEEVLDTLRTHPPDAVVYRHIDQASYLRIWPSSDPARLRMPAIENFFGARYHLAARAGKFELLRLSKTD
jgi:hypothetical protein